MSDGITDAERECNCELCQQLRSARECQKLHGIIYFSTKELTDELAKREGVKEIIVQPYEWYQVCGEKEQWDHGTGPARILVVWD